MNAPVVVIGGDVDALVCAQYLARAGHRVTVVSENAAHTDGAGWVPPHVIEHLRLNSAGLLVQQPDPWLEAAMSGGARLALWRDIDRTAQSIAAVSARDAARWPAFCERMRALASVLEALYVEAPPDPLATSWSDLAQLARAGLRARRLGAPALYDLLRVLPMSVADLLDEWFESDVLKGALGAAGVLNLAQGPRAAGTAFSFLHHHVGSPAGVFRPPSSNAHSVLRGLGGLDVRDSAVARIDVREQHVEAVVLATGERIETRCVASAVSPRRTLLELIDPAWLDPELVRAVRNVRARGVAAHVSCTLRSAPDFTTLCLAPSLDHIERAYDAVKYGRASVEPWIEARYTGTADGDRHRLEVHVQYVPHTMEPQEAEVLAGAAIERLASHAPALAASIVDRQVRTPADLARVHGFPQGQPYHAEIALDQVLWMRPVPALARYRTPIEGLYLCGPAMHPGGGIAGAAGANAASVILTTKR